MLAANIWEHFDPAVFAGGLRLPGGATDPHLAGVQLSQWNVGQSAGEIEQDIAPMFEALSQKAWGSTAQAATWSAMAPTVAAIGRAPGFVATPIPPGATSLPGSPAEVFGNSQNVFTITADGSVKHSWWQPGMPAPQTELLAGPGTATGTPIATGTAIRANLPRQDVFVRGTNGHLLHWSTDTVSGGWQLEDWTAMAAANGDPSPTITGDPAAVSYGSQEEVFARGADGSLHRWWLADDQVHGQSWGGAVSRRPAAAVVGYDQTVVAVDPHGALWRWSWQPDGSVSRTSLATGLAAGSSPSMLVYQGNRLHAYVRDASSHLLDLLWTAGSAAVTTTDFTAATGYAIAGNPASYVYKTQQHIFFRDAHTGHLDHIWNTPGRGLGHEDVTTVYPGDALPRQDPAGFNYLDREQHVFSVDADMHLQHWWWTEATNGHGHDTWW